MLSSRPPFNLLKAAGGPITVIAACLGIAVYVAYHLTKFRAAAMLPPVLRADAFIIYDSVQIIFRQASYPAGTIFPYPPSAVLVFRALGLGGPAVFMGAWYALMVAGLLVAAKACVADEGRDIQAAWLAIAVAAIQVADSPISWDLRNANSNLICLGIVMAGYGWLGRRPLLAGTLIGLSVAFKVYSGLLLVWLLFSGPRRAAIAAGMTVMLLWAVLPLVLFGVDGTRALYASWFEQVRTISDPAVHAGLAAGSGGPPLVTLERAVVALTGGAFGATNTRIWLWALWSGWLAVLAFYAWRGRASAPQAAPSRAALADWVVLLLAPLPFSPWLEPYHAVPAFAGAVLCIVIAADEHLLRRDRLAALTALGTFVLFTAVKIPFAVRGLGITAQFAVLVLVLGFVRPRLRPPGSPPDAGKSSAGSAAFRLRSL